MKKILVPTDFSANAQNALEYAIEIANTFGSEITLLHTYRLIKSVGMLLSTGKHTRSDAEKEMKKLTDRFEARLRNGARFQTEVLEGDAAQVIGSLAKGRETDLIIMGTQGAGGLKEIFIGSTTNSVVRHSDVPVLVIPSGYQGRPPVRVIVLAMDESALSFSGILTPVVKLARAFNAKVRVYHKDTGPEDTGIDPTVDMFLEGVDHSFHYELDTDHIHENIKLFVQDYEGDLLCMVRRSRGFLNDLFRTSNTRREIFDCSIPLLVLHDREA